MQAVRTYVFLNLLLTLACATPCVAAPPIELELATERGLQITAPQEWLQLLAGIGLENVRIRGTQPGDAPKVANSGTDDRPRFEVLGIITARNQLELAGGTFSRSDVARIKDYFDRLAADGAESLTATRGMFGLTEKEITAVFTDLAQPIDFPTKGQLPQKVIDRLQAKFASKLQFETGAQQALRDANPVADDFQGIAAGTALAIILRTIGLEFRPEKARGEPIVYVVSTAGSSVEPTASSKTASGRPPVATRTFNRAGRTDDNELKHWPIGWELHDTPGRTAPSLFVVRNAEIEGYSLAETLAALAPLIKIPMLIDQAALAAHDIDLTKVQVVLPKTRSSYKRVIDRALATARLGSQVRTDDAGKPFLWITR
jgi:hypothetical protein